MRSEFSHLKFHMRANSARSQEGYRPKPGLKMKPGGLRKAPVK